MMKKIRKAACFALAAAFAISVVYLYDTSSAYATSPEAPTAAPIPVECHSLDINILDSGDALIAHGADLGDVTFQGAFFANEVCGTKIEDGVAVNVDGRDFGSYAEIEDFAFRTSHADQNIAIGYDVDRQKISFVADSYKVTAEYEAKYQPILDRRIKTQLAGVEPNDIVATNSAVTDITVTPLAGKFDACNVAADFTWEHEGGNCLKLYDRGENYTPSNGIAWNNMRNISADRLNAIVYYTHPGSAQTRFEVPVGGMVYMDGAVSGQRVDLY